MPEHILRDTPVFHLSGGIECQKLTFKHSTMMTLLCKKAKLPEEKKTAEVRAMIETFNSKVDFVDYISLNKIVEAIQLIPVYHK